MVLAEDDEKKVQLNTANDQITSQGEKIEDLSAQLESANSQISELQKALEE